MDAVHKCVDKSATVGRILIGVLFLVTGVGALLGFQGFVAYTGSVLPMATLMAILAIIFKIGGGLSLILGVKPRLGSYALILFTFLAVVFFHLKGTFAGDQSEMVMALKDIAIIGGLLLVAKSSPVVGGMCMGVKCMGKKCEGKKCEGKKCEGKPEESK